MTIAEVISALQQGAAIVVRDKTFELKTLETAILDTGENVYWAYAKDGMWLSIDPGSEEIVQYEDLNEELEPEDDTVVYGGDDYEFSYEGAATLKDDETAAMFTFREFENSEGRRIRITVDEANTETSVAIGSLVTEEEIQEA